MIIVQTFDAEDILLEIDTAQFFYLVFSISKIFFSNLIEEKYLIIKQLLEQRILRSMTCKAIENR